MNPTVVTRMLFVCSVVGTLHAQRIETLIPGLGGHVAQDSAGHLLVAQSAIRAGFTDRSIRVRSLAEDPPGFDVVIGGSGDDDLAAMLVDPTGNILLLGTTNSRDFPAAPSALWPHSASPERPSSFLVRLDPAGRILSSTYIGSTDVSIQARTMAIAPDGALILGLEVGGVGIITFGQRVIEGEGAVLVLRTDTAAESLLGGVRLGGKSSCRETLAAVQSDGHSALFVAGTSCSDDLPTTSNAYLTRKPSGICSGPAPHSDPLPCRSGFIVRLDLDLQILASTYLGGTASAFLRGIAVDRDGSPYVTGMAEIFPAGDRDAFPTTPGAYQERTPARTSVVRPESVFVTKLRPDLSGLVYSTLVGGSRSENPSSILVDGAGRAVIGGGTISADFPVAGAFRTPCGPDEGVNQRQSGFVTRLDAEGQMLSSSARMAESYVQLGLLREDRYLLATAGDDLTLIDLNSGDAPSVACVVNGLNFRPERSLAPNEVITFLGANFSPDTIVLFDYLRAQLLYVSPTQINAVVPRELAGRTQVSAVLVTGSEFSNTRAFAVDETHPSVKVFIDGDGRLVDTGSPLADVRLSDGTSNSFENPARQGDTISIFTTGVDLLRRTEVLIGGESAELLESMLLADTFESVQILKVRVPHDSGKGARNIQVTNGGQSTEPNAAFVWID